MSDEDSMNSTLDSNAQPCTMNSSDRFTANVTLDQLNAIERNKQIGGVIFVSTLMVVGIFGNLHVLFVYVFKTKVSSRRTFIVVLGALDLIASTIGMPFIVFDLLNPLTFDLPSVCKILRFVNYFVSTSSIFILMVIAVDRYRKVCKPLGWQISKMMANFLCLGFILVSASITWPAAILYGSSDRGTSNPNVTGISCLIQAQFETTPYPFLFNTILLLVVFMISTCLIVLYCLIWRTITTFRLSTLQIRNDGPRGSSNCMQKHHGRSPPKDQDSPKTEVRYVHNQSETSGTVTPSREPEVTVYQVTLTPSGSSSDRDLHRESQIAAQSKRGEKYLAGNENESSEIGSNQRPFAKIHRTTLTFCLITVVFIISYFPHLILKIISLTKSGFFESMSPNGQFVYNTFIWCFYVNHVANAIIYGYCDSQFRREVSLLYKKLGCACTCVCP